MYSITDVQTSESNRLETRRADGGCGLCDVLRLKRERRPQRTVLTRLRQACGNTWMVTVSGHRDEWYRGVVE